ncbi:hypothetical protein QE152_g12703 [Popillia japonica]|uniref:C2H2-type domain-containing protein n=1 Tax=Popillia japonica TaxID=7064 RepID=A0AAW1LQU8_POPJA
MTEEMVENKILLPQPAKIKLTQSTIEAFHAVNQQKIKEETSSHEDSNSEVDEKDNKESLEVHHHLGYGNYTYDDEGNIYCCSTCNKTFLQNSKMLKHVCVKEEFSDYQLQDQAQPKQEAQENQEQPEQDRITLPNNRSILRNLSTAN